ERRGPSMPLSAEERMLRSKIGAHALHATRDPLETTEAARGAAFAKFEHEVDPGRVLPEAERRRRARHAQQAHMARMALASVRARALRRGAAMAGGEA